MITINAKTSTGSYPIQVGANTAGRLAVCLAKNLRKNRLFVIYDANFYVLHGRALRRSLRISPESYRELVTPSGEKEKSQKNIDRIHSFLLDNKITRSDFILACGGGVTSDLVGFAAATVLRGVRWGVLPTTLLAMVDAAIGGKTGINHPLGKNLIGAFWQPSFAHIDTEYLKTLDHRQIVAGLGEVLKCAGLAGGKLHAAVAAQLQSGHLDSTTRLTSVIRLAVEYKAKLVARDERESGLRMVLNLGHTFAHGVEQSLGYGRLLHGEAVILGLWAALELGRRMGFTTDRLSRYRTAIESMITMIPRRKLNHQGIMDAMAIDKKRTTAGNRFVLLEEIGRPIITSNLTWRRVAGALEDMIQVYTTLGGRIV